MPTNGTGSYDYSKDQLDTGVGNIPPVNGFTPDPELTSNQNLSPDKFFSGMDATINQANPWLNSARFETPVNTRLKDTLRYDDAEFGFNANNPNLEYQYGDRQSFLSKWGNNLVKFGANTIGSFTESLATIPLVLGATLSGDLSKIENNSLTNGISEWLDNLENNLPNYETTFGKEHPVLDYIPLVGHSGDTWGGVLKNLGYTVGAIGGAIVQDVAIGAVTGGFGELPLVATQLTKAAGRLGKLFGAGEDGIKAFQAVLNGGKDIEKYLSAASKTAKIIDKTRYGLSLLTSATAEGMMEANQAMHNTKKGLLEDYFNEHGFDATGKDLDTIEDYSKSSGNATLLANVALLTLTNGLQFETLLKPTSLAKGVIESSIDDGLKIGLEKGSLDVLEAIPDVRKGFKGIISKIANSKAAESFATEGFEEGSQFVVQTGTEAFYKRKYDQPSMDGVDNFTTSLGQGLHDVFTTREGIENILIGGLSGSVIHMGRSLIEGRKGIAADKAQRLSATIDTLNANPLTGLFTDKYDAAVASYNISNKANKYLKEGDLYNYRNEKFNQLFNFVDAGIKTNRFDAQIERLQSVKELSEKDQRSLLKIEDPNMTKQQLDAHVDSMIAKAYSIKNDVEKINRVFKNPYNSRSEYDSYKAYEDYKGELAHSLAKVKDNRGRAVAMAEDIRKTMPNIDTDKLVNLTSERGIKQTISDLNEKIKNLKKDQELFTGEEKTKAAKEQTFLENKVAFLEGVSTTTPDTSSSLYYNTAYDLINYYNNGALNTRNHEIDAIDVIEGFNNAHDIELLNLDTEELKEYYNRLVDKKGLAAMLSERAAVINEARRASDAKKAEVAGIPEQEIDENGNPITPAATPAKTTTATPAAKNPKVDVAEEPFDPDKADAEMAKDGKEGAKKGTKATENTEEKNLKQQLKDLKKELADALSSANIGPKGTLSAVETQANIAKINEDYKNKISELERQIQELKDAAKPAKEAKAPTPKIESANQGNRKYDFHPIKYFTKIFTWTKKLINGQNEGLNLRDLVLSKDIQFLYDNMTIKASDSISDLKFGEYYKLQRTEFDENGVPKLSKYDNIYYTGYKYDFAIQIDGKQVGRLQPSYRLSFLRDGKHIPLSEITREEYEKVTGNKIDTFEDFKEQLELYDNLYNKIEREYAQGKTEFTNADIKSMFTIGLTYGNIDYASNAADSTLLKNINYSNNNVILSLPFVSDGEVTSRTTQPTIIGKENLTPEAHQKLLEYLSKNIDKINNKLNSRYVFVTMEPSNNYGNLSAIAARPSVVTDEQLAELYKTLTTKPAGQNEAVKINKQLKEKFYITDSSNTKGRGTNMYFTLNKDGDLIFNIIAPNFEKRLLVPGATKKKSFNELIDSVNNSIKYSKDSRVQALSLRIAKSDIKSGILNDDNVTYESLKNSLAVAVKGSKEEKDGTTKIFEHPTINILPLGAKKATVTPKSEAATPAPAAPAVKPVVAPNLGITELFSGMANDLKKSTRENVLKEVANNTYWTQSKEAAEQVLSSLGGEYEITAKKKTITPKGNPSFEVDGYTIKQKSKVSTGVSNELLEIRDLENQELGFLNMVKRNIKEGGQYIARVGSVTYEARTKADLKYKINNDFNEKRKAVKEKYSGATEVTKKVTTPTETKLSTQTAESFLKDKAAKAQAREEAKSQSIDDVTNDFLNSLGCK